MRSLSVVLPESMCAEIPMLRTRSMLGTSSSALLDEELPVSAHLKHAPGPSDFSGRHPGARAAYPVWVGLARPAPETIPERSSRAGCVRVMRCRSGAIVSGPDGG